MTDESTMIAPPVRSAPAAGPLVEEWSEVSPHQHALWLMYQMRPALRGTYNIAFTARLATHLEADRLAHALEVLIARHPMLRARFASSDGRLLQRIESRVRLPLSVVEMNGDEPKADGSRSDEASLLSRVEADSLQPFDETTAPLMRARMYRGAGTTQVLLVVFDHLICDGWSFFQLIEELGEVLQQGSAAQVVRVERCEFLEYVAQQRAGMAHRRAERQLQYWQAQLAETCEPLDLPPDRFEPETRATRVMTLDRELTRALRELCDCCGVSMFATLLASYFVLLHRLSGQSKLSVGTPLPARGGNQWASTVGLFRNPAVMRVEMTPTLTIAQLFAQLHSKAWQALKHQEYPFPELVQRLGAAGAGPASLFQTMFVFQKPRHALPVMPMITRMEGAGSAAWGGLVLEQFGGWRSAGAAGLELMLEVMEVEDRLSVAMDYNAGRFEASTIEQYLASWQAVLRSMASDPNQPLERVSCMTPACEAALRLRNATAVAYPREACIHELFEAQVERTPAAIAVEHGAEQLSYRELNDRANRLAYRLRTMGVRPDTAVAICVQRGIGMVVSVLAVLKAGGAYVPLDPGYPAERLGFMLQDAEPLALLTDRASRAVLPQSLDLLTVDVGEYAHQTQRSDAVTGESAPPLGGVHPNQPRSAHFSSQRLAYVIYTSGSTGTPKGVMVEHRSVVNFLCSMQRAPGIHTQDRVLALTSLSFDIAALELYLPLISGARLIVGSREDAADGQRIAALLERHRITVLQGTPSMWQLLLASGWAGRSELTALCGGEALTRQLSQQIVARVRCLWNLYGPTETTIWSTAALIDTRSAAGQSVEPIGRPIANTSIHILDARGEPVPMGVRGEIYIGGAGVARGYLKRPELTSERFLQDRCSEEPAARMYRTGDLGRWHASGDLEYLGRNDTQVKLRGFRIELGEIEAQLLEHAQIRQAVAMVREDQPGNARLVAYYLGAALEPAQLRAHLESRLPAYMIPAAYVWLQELPLTPNGKLNRKALPAPSDDAHGRREFEMPQGELETTLARIWQDLLGVRRVGRHDSFFELGGHSLLALTLVARLRLALHIELELQQVFATPRLRDLACAARSAPLAALPALLPVARAQRLPASNAQQQLWLLAQLPGASAAYHLGGGLWLRGSLNRTALQRALQELIARHETLRTSFLMHEGQLEQRIASAAHFELRERDCPAQSVAEAAALEVAAGFDLERGPLIRAQLLRVSAQEHVLVLTLHHIVCDGWSLAVLVRELCRLYAAQVNGAPAELPALAVQFADYAVWQRHWLSSPAAQEQREYWRRALSGAPVLLELPGDRPRPARQDFAGERVAVCLPAELVAGLRSLSARHGLTLYMTLLAGWAALLSRLSGQAEVVIGSPVANRRHQQLEGLIGMFVNSLAMRLDVPRAASVQELLAQVRRVSLEAQQHQDLPFEQVVELLQPPRTLAHSPLFQVMFAWQNTPPLELELPSLSISTLEVTRPTAQFDLSLSLAEANDAIVGTLEYSSSLFEVRTIERYLGYFQSLLAAMVANDTASIARLPLLSAAERREVLYGWNATQRDHAALLGLPLVHQQDAADRCVPRLIEEQVARNPEHPAVIYAQRVLSYGELDAEANRLAHYLLEQGVTADTLVAVCMERSIEMVVSLLAILKAGAAYVPIEPDLPPERIGFMLTDSAARVVLTQSKYHHLLGEGRAVLCVDASRAMLATRSALRPLTAVSPDDLAYVIYTSGSTGMPKGCMLTHAGLTNRLLWMQREYRLHGQDRVLQKTPYGFDVSVWEFFWPLLCGATLVVAAPQGHKDPQYLMQLIEAQHITTCHFVPSMLKAFLKDLRAGRCTSLRQVFASGEALSYETYERFAQLLGCKLHNLYGPTEAAIDVSFWECAPRSDRRIPIGRPIDNIQLYVLDEHLEPVPMGVAGELHIGGIGLARGYLNRPQLTAEKFIDDPFGAPGSRLYKTGDLARWLPEGTLEYLGRLDHQVKLRGLRIELGEIESCLQRHPRVRQCAVALREHGESDQQLVAYYVAHGYQSVAAVELREFLRQSLPEYMVPAAWVALDELPLTSSGKLDRKALPAPQRRALVERLYEPPQGEIEQALAQIWQRLLQVPQVGRQDDFFELGGNSLLAMHFISALRTELQMDLPLAELFIHPRLGQVAERLVEQLLRESDIEEITRLVEEIELDRQSTAGRQDRPGLAAAAEVTVAEGRS